MKRFAVPLGLILAFGPAMAIFAQDRDPAAPREEPRGDRPREGERPREGFGGRGEGFGGGPMGRGEGPGRMMARLPIMMALDADQDGTISANEIDLAVVALKKLDKNKDGKLTMDELMPSFEGMPGGPGGFAGPGGPGGFGGGFGGVSPQDMVARLMEGDKDNDGYLSESELPERMRAMIGRADTDGDKKLSRDELIVVAQRQMQAGRGEGPGRGESPGRGAPREGSPDRPRRPTSE
jgi:EF hand